jgi:GNAT superfamily N-acetyltransferase
MACEVVEVPDPAEKAAICDAILRSLPEWFGIEAAIVDYVQQSRGLPLFAAREAGSAVGFAALRVHTAFAAEICVMGVRAQMHRRGIGRLLITACERFCRGRGIEFLTVKTLDASRPHAGYARTRAFYLAQGFRPLEVLPTLWDPANPCLLLAKHLGD